MESATCYNCGSVLDLRDAEVFETRICGGCGAKFVVPLSLGHLRIYSLVRDIGCFSAHEGFDARSGRDVMIYLLKDDTPEYGKWFHFAREEVERRLRVQRVNVYPIAESGVADGVFYYIAPIAKGVFLDRYLNAPGRRLFKVETVIDFARDVAIAIDQAHKDGLVHHDICPENLHIDTTAHVRLHNFPASRVRYEFERATRRPSSVSPYYVSPEKARHGEENEKGDIFSFAVLFYYLLTGKYPFEDRNELVTIYSRVLTPETSPGSKISPYMKLINPKAVEYRPPVPPIASRKKTPQAINDLIVAALSPFPERRPTFVQILSVLSAHRPATGNDPAKLSETPTEPLSATSRSLTDSRSIPMMRHLASDARLVDDAERDKRKKWLTPEGEATAEPSKP